MALVKNNERENVRQKLLALFATHLEILEYRKPMRSYEATLDRRILPLVHIYTDALNVRLKPLQESSAKMSQDGIFIGIE